MKKEEKLKKLEKRNQNLGFWRLAWSFPIKGVLILSALATLIAFPFNLTAGFVCLGVAMGSLAISGINHLCYDKIDELFYEKIRKNNLKISKIKDEMKEKTMTYEEYKKQNSNTSTLVINYPDGEKRVSTLFNDKGVINADENEIEL